VPESCDVGNRKGEIDAETTPLAHPEHYQYDFNLPDVTGWRRGGDCFGLLDLTAAR